MTSDLAGLDPAALALQLHLTIADLDGHIERRGQDLAGPAISRANAAADVEVGRLRAELDRCNALIAELRRIIDIREDQLDELRVKHGERRDQQVAARREEKLRQRAAVTVRMRVYRGRVMHLVEPAGAGLLRSKCRVKHPVKGVNSTVPRAEAPAEDWAAERYDYPDCRHCPSDEPARQGIDPHEINKETR